MQKKPVHRANRLESALTDIQDAEQILSKVQMNEDFQALKLRHKLKFEDVLSGLRGLIYDLEEETAQAQLAS